MLTKIVQLFSILLFTFIINSCKTVEKDVDIFTLKAPEQFKAKFLTTKGEIEVTAERKLSPLAVDRFYQLIKSGYFTDIPIYRGVPNFVAQFGTLDSIIDNYWSKQIIEDEPVKKSNDVGTIAFARAEKNTRGSQLFINLKNNARLDTVTYGGVFGFPAFAWVSKGMEVVNKFCTEYNDEPRKKLDSTIKDIPAFLKKEFPNMDYIKSAIIIE
jgi:cyclophilin family peptidyl-prolyl cis-trans isomerase